MDRIFARAKKLVPQKIFSLLAPIYHWKLAFLGALMYGFPSKSMKVIGVTGTSGKTTTLHFLEAIFREAGYKTAALSGLSFKILGKEEPNLLKMTMPGRFRVQRFLSEAKRNEVEYVFLEVTSEGIKQFRHKFIKFYAALLTNLSPEHIESHRGFENYRNAKAKLFKIAPTHVLNGDDENFDFFNRIPARNKVVFRKSDYPEGLKINLAGEFNKMNAVGAMAFARFEGVAFEVAERALEKVKSLPGRMEFVETGKDFKILVDYAFLPQALEKVYGALATSDKRQATELICVIGAAGGGRDKWKRPVLGDVAAEFCKKVIVTNEDPYDEDPMEIIREVSGGHQDFLKILDRREAIREALKSAKKGDTVVITGKGAEPWIMEARGKKVAWDDRAVAREELRNI